MTGATGMRDDLTAVVIAARNAAGTIATAVASALDQPETSELVVVDDGSVDATADAARMGAERVGRADALVVLRANGDGPAAARNRGIDASRAPFVAVLDADDAFLPGRLAVLHEVRRSVARCDVVADDIAFVTALPAPDQGEADAGAGPAEVPRGRELTLDAFIEGNRTVRGRVRGELGFLKPLFSRAFLQTHGLRYREDMRLGEDFDLLARVLARGAAMQLVQRVGYAALVRDDSLSAQHETGDLERLWRACVALGADGALSRSAMRALRHHAGEVELRWRHRRFLDARKVRGTVRAGLEMPVRLLPAVGSAVLRDKLAPRDVASRQVAGRTLLSGWDDAGHPGGHPGRA